jgi:hypothetical protein
LLMIDAFNSCKHNARIGEAGPLVLARVPLKTGPGVSGEESEAAGVLLAYRPDYLFPVTTMHFLTNPLKAGTREWAKCACWVLVRRAQFRFCCGGMCLVLSDDPKICSD